MIKGKRIRLIPLEKEHLSLLKRWRNDPEIRKHHFSFMPCTDFGQEVWYENTMRRGKDIYFIIEYTERRSSKSSAQPVGYCCISDIDWIKRRGVSGIIIGEKKYWNRKLSTEALALLYEYAFCEVGLHKISIYLYSDNVRSLRLHSRFAKVEGELVAHEFQDGKWNDVTVMGLTESMYFSDIRGKNMLDETDGGGEIE